MATTPDAAARVLARRPGNAVRPAAAGALAGARYSGLVTRAIAGAVDAALINLAAIAVAGVVALVLSIFPVAHSTNTLIAAVGGVVFAVWVVAYFVGFWTTTGQTPGNRVMRIRVVRGDGTHLRPGRALGRFAGVLLGLPLFIGYLPILVTDRRRGLQDWLGDTVVIDEPGDDTATPTRGSNP